MTWQLPTMRLTDFTKAYGTDEACRAHMESVRWPDGLVCLKCGAINEAVPISTRPGQFRCRPCGKQFNVLMGTALEGTTCRCGSGISPCT